MRRISLRTLVALAAAVSATPVVALAQSDGSMPYSPQRALRGNSVGGVIERGLANPPGGLYPSAGAALGGTSGTWVGPGNDTFFGLSFTTADSTWNDPDNWTPAIPNAGGVAYIGRPFDVGLPERRDSVNPILNLNVTLESLISDNELASAIVGTTNTITTASNGLTIQTRQGLATPFTGSFVFSDGFRIYPKITGSGSVTVVGSGTNFPIVTTFANASNDFTGGLFVTNGGIVNIDEIPEDLGDDEPGIPYTGEGAYGNGTIVLNGGSLWMTSGSQSPTVNNITKPIRLEAGGGTILTATAQAIFANEFSGPGNLNLIFPTTKLFTGVNTFTGNLKVGTGKVALQQGGSMLNTPRADIDGKLELDNQVGVANRLGDNSTVQLNSAKLNLIGDPTSDVDEKIGTLSVSGYSTVTAQTQFGRLTSISADNLVRNGRATVLFRGENIGTPGVEGTRFNFTNAPSQIGGIIPFAIAASYATGSMPADEAVAAPGQIGLATLTRYDAARGVVPLDLASDYSINSIASAASNVKVDTASTLSGTLNALVMGNTANNNTTNGAVLSGGPLNITAGVILNNSNGSVINNPITSSAGELIIHSTSAQIGGNAAGDNGLRLAGVISGNLNVTRAGHGNVYFFGANTYTGETLLVGGRSVIVSDVLPNQPGPFGQAPQSVPIRLVPGSTGPEGVAGIDTTRLFVFGAATTTIGREIIVEGTGVGGAQIGQSVASGTLVIAGNLVNNATDDLVLSGRININGNVSGTGNMVDLAGAQLRFSGNNGAWSGGFEFNGTSADATPTTVFLASPNAFGTGEVFLSGPTKIVAESAPRTMINNFVMDPSDAGFIALDGELTLAGDVFGASFTRTFVIPSTGNVTFSGDFLNSGYRFSGAGTLNGTTVGVGGGTLTLSGDNNHNGRLLVGGVSGATPSAGGGGTLSALWVRLASNNALGQAGIQMDADTSVIELVGGVNLPDRNIFILGEGKTSGAFGAGTLASGALRSTGGDNTMAGDVILRETDTVGQGLGAIHVAAATTLTVTGQLQDITGQAADGTLTAVSDGGTFRKIGGGTLVVPRIIDASGDSAATGTITVAAPITRFEALQGTTRISAKPNNNVQEGVSLVRQLAVDAAAGAKLDLTNNSLLVDYSGASVRSAIEALITSGYAGGTWTGNGIVSSAANAGQLALGVAEATDTSFFGLYQGVAIDADTVIVRFTRYGDANLDGTTGLPDFARLGANFNLPGRWGTGDFNFDGSVGIADFSLLAANFNLSAIDPGGRANAVPEPASLGIAAAAGLLARRRRN
jgi:hypothetical protein